MILLFITLKSTNSWIILKKNICLLSWAMVTPLLFLLISTCRSRSRYTRWNKISMVFFEMDSKQLLQLLNNTMRCQDKSINKCLCQLFVWRNHLKIGTAAFEMWYGTSEISPKKCVMINIRLSCNKYLGYHQPT